MKLKPDEAERIRLLSEGELYQRALAFVAENQEMLQEKQINSQLNGLVNASRSWSDLKGLVSHQKGRWVGSKDAYDSFYNNLKQELAELLSLARQFVPDGLTKNEASERSEYIAGLLAQDFIQHLVAEMMWQKEVQS